MRDSRIILPQLRNTPGSALFWSHLSHWSVTSAILIIMIPTSVCILGVGPVPLPDWELLKGKGPVSFPLWPTAPQPSRPGLRGWAEGHHPGVTVQLRSPTPVFSAQLCYFNCVTLNKRLLCGQLGAGRRHAGLAPALPGLLALSHSPPFLELGPRSGENPEMA